jgi:hypothetical protein
VQKLSGEMRTSPHLPSKSGHDNDIKRYSSQDKTTSSQPAKSSQKRHRKDSSASDKSSSSHDKWLPTERKKLKRSSFRDSSSDSDDIAIIENPTPKKSPASTSLGCLGRDGKTQNKEEDLGIYRVWNDRSFPHILLLWFK